MPRVRSGGRPPERFAVRTSPADVGPRQVRPGGAANAQMSPNWAQEHRHLTPGPRPEGPSTLTMGASRTYVGLMKATQRPADRALEDVDVVLRDGSTIHLRAAVADDRDALERFLTGLSTESRVF